MERRETKREKITRKRKRSVCGGVPQPRQNEVLKTWYVQAASFIVFSIECRLKCRLLKFLGPYSHSRMSRRTRVGYS